MTELTMLPLVANGTVATRTKADRLEVLTALINAPTFDPLFASNVIRVPGDHPVYAWLCGVPHCQRARGERHTFCKAHDDQWRSQRSAGCTSIADFLRTAEPFQPVTGQQPPACRICPDIPASGRLGLCFRHADRWNSHRRHHPGDRTALFNAWLAAEQAFPGMGKCRVVACPDLAGHPIGLCRRHHYRYAQEGSTGGAAIPADWGRRRTDFDTPAPVSYDNELAFHQWCAEAKPVCRMNGVLSLLGLPPLVRAEIQWTMFRHILGPDQGAHWPIPWIQYVADDCRSQAVTSLADLEVDQVSQRRRQIAKAMLDYLRPVYFTRQDAKDAGFIETDHYGVRFTNRSSHVDLTGVSQRWLRDLLWNWLDTRLTANPPRSKTPFDVDRRGCNELSAYLQAQAPNGGHDPTLLTAAHMNAFAADQRHRAEHGLPTLAIRTRGGRTRGGHNPDTELTTVTKPRMADVFNGARRVLRAALESGDAERIGLDRAFIVALPNGGSHGGRRRPFPDPVAQALADEANLELLDSLDPDDRGLREIWEALILTGRRTSEVLELRLECISRLGGLPMFWHDQTKVGNFDQAIRIPERLHERIERRQAKTITRFLELHGRPPTDAERPALALFPRKQTNFHGRKSVGYGWFHKLFRSWIEQLDLGHCVPHQARHMLATNLLRNGANLSHVKRYLGQVSERMAEHYVHLANTDPRLEDALNAVWVAGPGSASPGTILSGGQPMTRQEAEAIAIDLGRHSTPAEGGFCTFQPVVHGGACPWNLDCHNCDKFVMSGADLLYWHRKREHWRTLAERAPDSATADYLHQVFEPTARAIAGLEQALAAVGLLNQALALDLRRPQDYFGRVWSLSFRAQALAGTRSNEERQDLQ